jgi:glycosyltransferase involved in cell wall biosynthesis
MWRLILLSLIALLGFWYGASSSNPSKLRNYVSSKKEISVSEYKSFVILIYAYNQDQWCERALRSVFEQDYENYRLIVINDASIDRTEERAKQFIIDNSQDGRVIFITNETHLGLAASLHRAIDNCLNREIVIPLLAKDWLSSDLVLKNLNIAYQNPDVWLSSGQSIDYPSYMIKDEGQISFYAELFKKIPLKDLGASYPEACHAPLRRISRGKICKLNEPLSFCNLAPAVREGTNL